MGPLSRENHLHTLGWELCTHQGHQSNAGSQLVYTLPYLTPLSANIGRTVFFSENERGAALTVMGGRYSVMLSDPLHPAVKEVYLAYIWLEEDAHTTNATTDFVPSLENLLHYFTTKSDNKLTKYYN